LKGMEKMNGLERPSLKEESPGCCCLVLVVLFLAFVASLLILGIKWAWTLIIS
jgi:hypothetical protein